MSAMHSSPKLTRRALCTHTEVNQMGKPVGESTGYHRGMNGLPPRRRGSPLETCRDNTEACCAKDNEVVGTPTHRLRCKGVRQTPKHTDEIKCSSCGSCAWAKPTLQSGEYRRQREKEYQALRMKAAEH